MEENKKISHYLDKIEAQENFLASHCCLFLAIFSVWEKSNFSLKFKVSRKILMRLSKIASTATYHKCLKDLIHFGFIKYEPTYDYFRGSKMSILKK